MQEEVQVTIREAVPDDAQEILTVMKQIGQETSFLVLDEAGINMSEELFRLNLADLYESPNNSLFVAVADQEIVGTASVTADTHGRMEHIGKIGISIRQHYWGYGLGTTLLEEIILWSKETQIIRRLELTVQVRNKRAVQLYQKMGFKQEAVMPRGAKTDEGEFLDVYLMSLLID